MLKVRFAITLLTLAGVASCDNESPTYEIAGHTYCVPKEYSVPDVPWVPDSPLYSGAGFAFEACLSRTRKGDCPFPANVDGGTFGEATTVGDWTVDRLPSGAHYARILRDPLSSTEVVSDTTAIVTNPDTREWFVVRVSEVGIPATGQDHAYEEILAVCQDRIDYRGVDGSRRSFIGCSRHAIRDALGISYGFESATRAPDNVVTLDDRILSVMQSWRCDSE